MAHSLNNSLSNIALGRLPGALRGPIARGAMSTAALRLVNVAAGFLIAVLLGRFLGAEGYGIFAFGLSVAWLLSIASRAGVPMFAVRMISAFSEQRDRRGVHAVLKFGALVNFTIGVVTSLLAIYFFTSHAFHLHESFRIAGVVGAVTAPIITFSALAQGALRGVLKPFRAYFPEFVVMQGLLLSAVILLIVTDALTPYNMLVAYTGAWLISCFVIWRWVIRNLAPTGEDSFSVIQWKEWLLTAGVMMFGGMIALSLGRIETVMLAAYVGPEEVGRYAIAFRFAVLATFPGFALSSSFGPMISRLNSAGDEKALKNRLKLGALASTVGAFGAAAAVSVIAWIALPVINKEFLDARVLVLIIASGFALQGMMGRPNEVLNMSGNARWSAIGAASTAPIGLLLLWLLTSAYGAFGAAIATSITVVLHALILSVLVWKRTGNRCDVFAQLIPTSER